MIRFTMSHFILFLILSDEICSYIYVSQNGVEIEYSVQFKRECRGEMGIFVILHSIPLSECILECGMRQHCKALSFIKRLNRCNLYSSLENENERFKGSCIEIRASDILIKKKPCPDCAADKMCNPATKECEITECLNYDFMRNGMVKGNLRTVGDRVQYTCNNGDMLFDAIECLPVGRWNITNDKCTNIMTNVALGKATTMSSIFGKTSGKFGVDGDTNQIWKGGSCFHTKTEQNPWWRVDLGRVYHVDRVVLYNRLDACCSGRTSDLDLMFATDEDDMVIVGHVDGQIKNIHIFNFLGGKE